MEAVLELLAEYLRSVYRIYTQQKEYRVRHELDTYKLLKLESNKKLIPVKPGRERARLDLPAIPIAFDTDNEEEAGDEVRGSRERLIPSRSSEASPMRLLNKSATMDEEMSGGGRTYGGEEEEDAISADDIQMFESENVHLYNELKGLSDEVEQIEKNVVDIARLQDIFTEKVLTFLLFIKIK